MDLINNFFEKLYYECDILSLTGDNCFNCKNGMVEAEEVIKAIEENNLKIIIDYDF